MKRLLMRSYQKLFLHPYFRIRTWWPLWYYVLNRGAREKLLSNPPALSPLQESIVEDLRRDGIATATLEELFPGERMLETLVAWEATHPPAQDTSSKKKFLREYWSLLPEIDTANPFLAFSLRDTVLDIVTSYFGMWVRLKQYNLIKIVPDPDLLPTQSQRWHRDPEEKRVCKAFIYLNDVNEDTGPFTYLPGSTYGNRYGHLFPQKPPEGSYPPDDAVERAAGSMIRSYTAPAGTVIFCDTSGLHFGGRARAKERIMFTAGYSSPLYSDKTRFTLPTNTEAFLDPLPEKVRFALGS